MRCWRPRPKTTRRRGPRRWQATPADGAQRRGDRALDRLGRRRRRRSRRRCPAGWKPSPRDSTLPISYRDLATLKRVLVAGETLSAAERKAALEPLTEPGRPYRPLALEQLALMAVEAGDSKGAIDQFNAILQESDATPGLRRRATQMIVALGGTPKAG